MLTREQVKMARAGLDWTAQDLADKAGVAVNTVRRFENGYDAMGDTLAKIEAAFHAEGVSFTDSGEVSTSGGQGVRLKPMLFEVRADVGGGTVVGHYEVRGNLVVVISEYGTKATQVGGSPPDTLARMMLRELVQEAGK